jgi:hypothetical protein
MRTLSLLLILAGAAQAQLTVTRVYWESGTNPSPDFNQWTNMSFDPFIGKTILHTNNEVVQSGFPQNIFSDSLFTWDGGTHGTIPDVSALVIKSFLGGADQPCGSVINNYPRRHHPEITQMVDTKRHLFIDGPGPCTSTSGSWSGLPINGWWWTDTSTLTTWGQLSETASSTPVTLPLSAGNQSFTVASCGPAQVGGITGAQSVSTGAWITGNLTSCSGTTLIINVLFSGGTGTFSDWNITLSNDWSQSATYDSTDDAIFSTDREGNTVSVTRVYCTTMPVGGGTPSGVLSAQQTARGVCTVPDQWVILNTNTPPDGMALAAFRYDATTDLLVFYGGFSSQNPSGEMTETWVLSPSSCATTCNWVKPATANSPATQPSTQCWQPPSASCTPAGLIGFAGDVANGTFYYFRPDVTSELWALNLTTLTWTKMSLTGYNAPNPIYMAYDSLHQKLISYGNWGSPALDLVEIQLPTTASGQFRTLGTWDGTNIKWLEVAGEISSLSAGATGTVTLTGPGISIPISVQEAIYPGGPTAGIARTNEPFRQGIPIPLSAGLTSTSGLSLSNTNVVSNSNMAVDNGTNITVATGACTFTLVKAHHNGLDTVVCGSTTVVSTGTAVGFALTGPLPTATYPGNATCSPQSGGSTCATLYTSAHDPNSTCSIEVNGPLYADILCTGVHGDGSGHTYMGWTARYYFWAGESYVKVTQSLRNAFYDGTNNDFTTAFKGFKSFEFRTTPAISGTLSYQVAVDSASCTSGVCSGTMTTSDTVTVYQAQNTSSISQWGDCSTACLNLYTPDVGYAAKKNGTTLASDTTGNVFVGGWADIANGSGVGVQIGVYQGAGYFPKSWEFDSGTDVRIGLWPSESSQNYYLGYPQYDTQDIYLNFHTSALSNPTQSFQKLQTYLLARAPISQYNTAGVFPYPLVPAATQDIYYNTVGPASNPTIAATQFCLNVSTGCIADYAPFAYRNYGWAGGTGTNQVEFRWSDLQNFLIRGYTGRWLNSSHFYRMEQEKTWPRADGTALGGPSNFTWRSEPIGSMNTVDPAGGTPNGFISDNSTLFFTNYFQQDGQHTHLWGINDYYMMTGDETMHDAILDGYLNVFLDTRTYISGTTYTSGFSNTQSSRSIGSTMTAGTALYQLLADTGNSNSSSVLSYLDTLYTNTVLPTFCTTALCNINVPPSVGISLQRGFPWGGSGLDNQCTGGSQLPAQHFFFPTTLAEGVWRYRAAKGSSWSGYTTALDYIDGITNFQLHEFVINDGSGIWSNGSLGFQFPTNGWRYDIQLTVPNNCGSGEYNPNPGLEGMWNTWYYHSQIYGALPTVQLQNVAYAFDQNQSGGVPTNPGGGTSDWGMYQAANVINLIENPPVGTLQDLTITSFVDHGGGSYTIGWTTPTSTTALRAKWGLTQIVDWIGFDNFNGVYIGNPTTTQNWFASTEVPSMPSPSAGSQTVTVSTGQTGLTAPNFMVRAMTSGSLPPSTGIKMPTAIR